jgi:hypothetical protein
LTDPGGTASFDEFLDQSFLVDEITARDVQAALNAWLPPSQYIEVRILPR